MTKQRIDFFASSDLDVAAFTPKTREDKKAPAAEAVKELAKAANFHSREPKPVIVKMPEKRAPRVHRTGRNVQFNVKASRETIDQIYQSPKLTRVGCSGTPWSARLQPSNVNWKAPNEPGAIL